MPDTPESPDAAPTVVAADRTPDNADAPEHIWIGGGGYHPDLNRPGLFLGQGLFEALRYPDGHLELPGVAWPPLLPPGTLASAASQQSGPQNITPGDATAAPGARGPLEAPTAPPPTDAAPESHESAPEDEGDDAPGDDAAQDRPPAHAEASAAPAPPGSPGPESDAGEAGEAGEAGGALTEDAPDAASMPRPAAEDAND